MDSEALGCFRRLGPPISRAADGKFRSSTGFREVHSQSLPRLIVSSRVAMVAVAVAASSGCGSSRNRSEEGILLLGMASLLSRGHEERVECTHGIY